MQIYLTLNDTTNYQYFLQYSLDHKSMMTKIRIYQFVLLYLFIIL